MKRLLKNCKILIKEAGEYKAIDGCLGIDGDSICYLGKEIPEDKYDEVKDMKDMLLMPGLYNMHGHSSMTLVRGLGSGNNLQDWLFKNIIPVEDKMTPQDVKIGMYMACLEMLAGGTVFVSDMYDYPWAHGEALLDSGMKADFCRAGISMSDTEEIPPNRFNECVELVRDFKDPKGRVKPIFCIYGEYMCKESFIRKIAEANKEFHVNVNAHISETEKEHIECTERNGKTPVQLLNDCGIFEENSYLAHCVWVNDKDMDIMAAKGVTAVHNPSSNMKLASGFMPVKAMRGKGVMMALGTDGCASNNNLNMFEEMHIAALIHKGKELDPMLLSAHDILDMATINGAKAANRTDSGSLEVGKKADIIALDTGLPHWQPCLDAANLLVYSAQASDVRMTMVDGEILYENGEYKTLDKEKIYYEFSKVIERLY